MQFDVEQLRPGAVYRLMAGLVVPRPIAWVSTRDAEGRVNLAPYSFFNVMGTSPPLVTFAPGNRAPGVAKDTPANIAATGDFVVNLVEETHAPAMNVSSGDFPFGVNEMEVAGLSAAPSDKVQAPRLAEAVASLECREHETLTIGANRLVIGVVVLVHVREGIVDPESFLVDPEHYRLVGRMQSPDYYTRTHELFRMPRPGGDPDEARAWLAQNTPFAPEDTTP